MMPIFYFRRFIDAALPRCRSKEARARTRGDIAARVERRAFARCCCYMVRGTRAIREARRVVAIRGGYAMQRVTLRALRATRVRCDVNARCAVMLYAR